MMRVHDPPVQRRGAVLIAVIVCLSIIMLVLAAIASRTLLVRRQLRQEHALQQAELLCVFGLQVAERKLAENESYSGEVRQVTPKELGGESAGKISIIVERDEGHAVTIRASATYPLEEQMETNCVRVKQLIQKNPVAASRRGEASDRQSTATKIEESNAQEN